MQTTPNDTNEHMEKRKTAPPGKTTDTKSHEPENENKIQKELTISWESHDGKTARQLDYIAINHRYGNAVRRAYAVKEWQANMAQQQQRKVIQMDIRPKLLKHYKKHKPLKPECTFNTT